MKRMLRLAGALAKEIESETGGITAGSVTKQSDRFVRDALTTKKDRAFVLGALFNSRRHLGNTDCALGWGKSNSMRLCDAYIPRGMCRGVRLRDGSY